MEFDASGYTDGVTAILEGFQAELDLVWQADVAGYLVGILTAAVVVVGVWYGVRAILRAMRTPR